MGFIFDTHLFIYLITGEKSVSTEILSIIANRSQKNIISIASIWEMTVKMNIGKLAITGEISTIYELVENSCFTVLQANRTHFETYLKLPPIHKDPFDRLIISQAIAEDLTLVTDDQHIKNYMN